MFNIAPFVAANMGAQQSLRHRKEERIFDADSPKIPTNRKLSASDGEIEQLASDDEVEQLVRIAKLILQRSK